MPTPANMTGCFVRSTGTDMAFFDSRDSTLLDFDLEWM